MSAEDLRSQNWDYSTVRQKEEYIQILDEDSNLDEKSNYIQEYITTVISSLGMFLVGLHFTWIAPILPTLLSGTFKIHITMEESVWVISLTQIGAIPGSVIASMLSNSFGRKKAILVISIPYIISSILEIFAENVWHYYIARFLAGLGCGASFAVIPMYVSEIASPKIRGLLSTTQYMSMKFAVIVVHIFGAYLLIVPYMIVCAIFPIIMFVLSFYLPETPYYHVMKQDHEKAKKSLAFLRKKQNIRNELIQVIEGYKEESVQGKQSFWDIFKLDYNRKSLLIVFVLLVAQQWAGGTAILSYPIIIFKDGRSSVSVESCGILLAIMNFVAVSISGCLVDRLGRKVLLLSSCLIQIIPLFTLAIYFYLQNVAQVEFDEYLRLTPLIALILFKLGFATGIASLPYILLGELFPTSVKAQAASFATISGSLLGVAANKMYQVVYTNFDYPITFGMFIVWDILAIIFIYFMVPETKKISLEEIQNNLRKSAKSKIQQNLK